jgi:hypothetical protein
MSAINAAPVQVTMRRNRHGGDSTGIVPKPADETT